MNAILYPVAETAEQALHAPRGFAEREREAQGVAGAAVRFVSEAVGPAFTREAEVHAAFEHAPHAPGDWKTVRPIAAGSKPRPPAKPTNRNGHRWPLQTQPKPGVPTVLWRLSVSYWRVVQESYAPPVPAGAARRVRRDRAAEGLDPRFLQALAHQPLRPIDPQRPLDIGLFERRLPEAPHIIVPDE